MNQKTPQVSVIIPCYNLGQYLEEAVNSVLAQTYQDFEIIIVNDGSTDEYTINLLRAYQKPKTRVIHKDNQGVSAARNQGIKESIGTYILPLDADDKIDMSYLEKAVYQLDKNPNLGIVYCEAELFGNEQGKWELPEYKFPDILIGNVIFCTALFRKSDWVKVNGYNTNMIYGREDHDFWLSIIELGREVYRIPEVLFFYRQRSGSRDKSMNREHLIHSYSQLFRNHQKLYTENIETVFEQVINLTGLVLHLEEQVEEIKKENTLLSFRLREINLIVFPNWEQPEESLYLQLEQVIKTLNIHPGKRQITLLIVTDNIPDSSDIDAQLIISSIAMNLLMEDDLDVSDGVEISLVEKLNKREWEALLCSLNYRLILDREEQHLIAEMEAENLPCLELDSLLNKKIVQLESGDWDLR